MPSVHHSAIQVRDLDASLCFYRDGIGLEVLMDHVFRGDWPMLFDAPSSTLRSVFLGDRHHPESGIVELVVFDRPGPDPAMATPVEPTPDGPVVGPSAPGFFLLSFYVDVDAVLSRLTRLGFGPARRIEQPAPTGPVPMASLYDPDGVRIELVGVAGTDGPG